MSRSNARGKLRASPNPHHVRGVHPLGKVRKCGDARLIVTERRLALRFALCSRLHHLGGQAVVGCRREVHDDVRRRRLIIIVTIVLVLPLLPPPFDLFPSEPEGGVQLEKKNNTLYIKTVCMLCTQTLCRLCVYAYRSRSCRVCVCVCVCVCRSDPTQRRSAPARTGSTPTRTPLWFDPCETRWSPRVPYASYAGRRA